MPVPTLPDVVRELAGLETPTMREVNERRGDDHGVNLTHLRALAKRLKTEHALALQLWATGDTAARLLATLVPAGVFHGVRARCDDPRLDQIEKEMKQAPAHKQWAMNRCLAENGIHHQRQAHGSICNRVIK